MNHNRLNIGLLANNNRLLIIRTLLVVNRIMARTNKQQSHRER